MQHELTTGADNLQFPGTLPAAMPVMYVMPAADEYSAAVQPGWGPTWEDEKDYNNNDLTTTHPTNFGSEFLRNSSVSSGDYFEGAYSEQGLDYEYPGDDDNFDIPTFYRTAIPIMLVFCVVSIITNVVIVVSVHWIRRTLSPTLCFSISLAVADGYASLVIGLGLVINSLLHVGYQIDLGPYYQCLGLTLEAFRMAGMFVSVFHLLALAINHYIGILRPLHYASTMTRRNALVSIAIMWTGPIVFFFTYFASIDGSGFQSTLCEDFNFLAELKYRIVCGSLFFVPLLLMVVAYVHIFVIVRQHLKGVLQYQNQSQLKKNVKAVFTTLLILGTYVFGWMPAVIFSLVTCLDCAYPFTTMRRSTVIRISFAINTLIIIKSLVDPIVYAARMKEIRGALHRMRKFCCGPCCHQCLGPDGGRLTGRSGRSGRSGIDSSSFRSRSDTTGTSIRLQSVHGMRKDRCGETPVLIYQTTANHELNSSAKGNGAC